MDQPIACTLNPSELTVRRAEIAELAREAVRSREQLANGARITFDPSPATEQRVQQLIDAESECCSFLRFDLSRDNGTLRLDVTGPPEGQPIIAGLFA